MGTAWAHVSARESGARSHSEITCEAVFGHEYHLFSLTCMFASCQHETCDHAWSLTLAFHITFTWGVATPLLIPPRHRVWDIQSIIYKEDTKLNNLYQAKLLLYYSCLWPF